MYLDLFTDVKAGQLVEVEGRIATVASVLRPDELGRRPAVLVAPSGWAGIAYADELVPLRPIAVDQPAAPTDDELLDEVEGIVEDLERLLAAVGR